MAKAPLIEFVPAGRTGSESIAHNLNLVSVLFNTFISVVLKERPEVIEQMLVLLEATRAAPQMPPEMMAVMDDAIRLVRQLLADK